MKIFLSFITSAFLTTFVLSQINVTNTQTPTQLVQDVLMGTGITALNVKYNGSIADANVTQVNATYFNSSATTFPLANGVLLTSGNGVVAVGPNNNDASSDNNGTEVLVDVDMAAITPNDITNGALIEFDFVATGDSISFEYLFGSEEYPDDYGFSYYDVFGFFLSGPGFTGTFSNGGVNVATLPGTNTPISILNLNPTTNQIYYVNNEAGLAYGNAIEYDGTSVVMKAGAKLICGETYHIKLGIANVNDEIYDSGVFLKGGSFSSDIVNIQATNAAGIVIDSVTIAEGCETVEILFIRPVSYIDSMQVFQLQAEGSVNLTTDLVSYVDSVVFNIGVDTVAVIISALVDGLSEPSEDLKIMIFTINTCGDTLYDSVMVYIVDPIQMDLTSTPASCQPDGSANVTTTGNFGVVDYNWTGPSPIINDTVHTPLHNNLASGWYVMTLSDDRCTAKDSVLVELLNPPVASLTVDATEKPAPAIFNFSNTSQNASTYTWNFGNGLTATSSSLAAQTSNYLSAGEYTVQLIAFEGLCSDTTYLNVLVQNLPEIINIPNVFSPEGDGINDEFYLTTKFVTSLHLVITNRWGNIVFDQTSPNPIWNGQEQPDGVYFFMYTATGIVGEILTGDGFIHLTR